MADLLLSARLEGDADSLVEATDEASAAVDKVADRAASAQKKIADAAKEATAAAQATTKATKEAAGAHDSAAEGASRHAEQVRRLAEDAGRAATQLATGRTSGEAFASSIAGVARNAIALGGTAFVVGAAIAGMFVAGIERANELHARAQALRTELAALGRPDNSGALLGIVDAQGSRTGATRASAGDALQQFLGAGIFDPSLVAGGINQARQLSLALGGELAPNAKAVADAMAGNGDALEKLDGKLRVLTDSERVEIRTLRELGQTQQAAGIVVEALGRRLDGLANQSGATGRTVSASFGEAWTRALENFAKTDAVQTAAKGMRDLGDAVAGVLAPDLATAQERLAQVNAELAKLKQLQAAGRGTAGQQVRIVALGEERTQLQNQIAAGNGAAQPGAVVPEDATKRVRELVEALDQLPRQREAISNAIRRINEDFAQGSINADLWGKAVDLLQGKLDGLRSPLERSQTALDNAQTLADAPRNQRAYLAAQQQAQEESLRLPPSERPAFLQNRDLTFLKNFSRETQDLIDDLNAASRNLLNSAQGFGRSVVGGLRAQAYGDAAERARTGGLEEGAVGAYAQGLLNQRAAGEVVNLAQQTQSYREQTEALERLAAAEREGGAAAREAERANQVAAATSKLRAAAEASGSAEIQRAAKIQIDAYEDISRRAMAAQRAREATSFNQQFDPSSNYAQQMARLRDLQATGLLTARTVAEATKQYEQQRLEASRDATDGMIAGLRRYADEAMNAGQQAAQGIRNGMQSAENALVQFAVTGQITIGNLVNSILADFARLAIRQTITGPLSKALGSLLGNRLGGLTGGGADPNTINYGGGSAANGYFHEGGIVGASIGRGRDLPLSLFAGARRYHDGGVVLGPNEVPAILQSGERVQTRQQQDAGGGGLVVNVHNYTDSKVSTRQGRSADGGPTLEVMIEPLQKAIAADIDSGRGPITDAIARTFGAQVQGH